MGKIPRYQSAGFMLLSMLEAGGLRVYEAAAVDIAKGDALHDDTAGYATNATTAFATTFEGIAGEPCANAGGAAGDLKVGVIPPLPQYQFSVPVEAAALITKTAVGEIFDLQSVNTIDLADTTGAADSMGFFVDEIDVSAAAIAANTFGYAIGHFVDHTA